MIRISPKTSDIFALAQALRDADREELRLGTGQQDTWRSIEDAVNASDICEALRFNDGRLAALWGVAPLGGLGSIWMLTTSLVEARPSQFLRVCPSLVQSAHMIYDSLVCAPWRGNDLHLRWLHWLGFEPGQIVGDFQLHTHVRTTCSSHPDAGRRRSQRGRSEERE